MTLCHWRNVDIKDLCQVLNHDVELGTKIRDRQGIQSRIDVRYVMFSDMRDTFVCLWSIWEDSVLGQNETRDL